MVYAPAVVQKKKTAVEAASASSLERVVAKVLHAKLDGIAALILIATYPDGGNCCSDGSYCTAGNICVNVRGSIKCCTDLTCSGHASGSVTISTPSATTASSVIPSSISIAPEPSITLTPIPVYEYYYYTITWYHWSYYYFKQLSATLSFPTPAAATLPIQTLLSSPTQTEQTTDSHTEVSIDTESLRGTGPASYSVSSTPSSTTRSVTSGSSSQSTATSTPAVVTVSGASGMRMNGRFWSITGFMVFGACVVALWLL
ncbi:hypothetical protein BTUL_0047g00300 [Botrytis tulipae]|uniref:Uncharacterized protein n=1 Tax=Botrytis tulipae TaxID=87230 RepID=A0A4Z1EVB3_9HELO|nr:hypothetical protein BTUL_0047g00300 [Botrytis tulipae]